MLIAVSNLKLIYEYTSYYIKQNIFFHYPTRTILKMYYIRASYILNYTLFRIQKKNYNYNITQNALI